MSPATLALRHPHLSIPTLLSPLTSDPLDDFQSNAWVNRLSGLGITCLRDGQPLPPEDSVLHMQVDGDAPLPAETRRVDTPDYFETVLYSGLDPQEIHRISQYTPNVVQHPTSHLELGLDSDIDPAASDIIGLIPDVNMYDKLRRPDPPYPSVNPLDTIRDTSHDDVGISYGEPTSLTPKDYYNDGFLFRADSRAEPSPSPRVIRDIMSILVQPPEFSFPPWSPANSPSAQSYSPRSPLSIKLEPTNVLDGGHHALPAPCNLEYPNTTHSSPVLNAHLGIELNELVSKAERFRTKYPERDIDRAWLSHFAGKLSDRGELLNDFRCYVIGCDQRNKRRDHILVHVGAHIGQRPFACSVWFVDSRLVVLYGISTEWLPTVRCGSCAKMNAKDTRRVTADSGHTAATFAVKLSSDRIS